MPKNISDNVGVGSKRKHSHKSCDFCRSRHKRCLHNRRAPYLDRLTDEHSTEIASRITTLDNTVNGKVEDAGDPQGSLHETSNPSHSESQLSPLCGSNEQIPHGQAGDADDGHVSIPETRPPPENQPSLSSPSKDQTFTGSDIRFVGNLSLEASFFATESYATDNEGPSTSINFWLVPSQPLLLRLQHATFDTDRGQNAAVLPISDSHDLQSVSLPLQKAWMSVLPSDGDLDAMSTLYFTKFDPIFPIIYGENIDDRKDAEATAIKQCICLVASLDPSMKPHLKLADSERIMSPMQFRSRLAEALKSVLQTDTIRNKMILLQITSLLAFYVDEPSSSEISSHYCAQAVEISQTLGLHAPYSRESQGLEKSHRLFWCIWALDRLNAVMNGRPTLINEQDTGEQLLSFVPDLPPFRLFLRICKLLDEVISQYRPRPKFHLDLSRVIPDFESLVCEVNAAELSSQLMSSLEIFYLSVRILGSRPQVQSNGPSQFTSSDAQFASAVSILTLSEEFKSSLTHWVALPYAVSLASSVEYQTLRNSKISHIRKRARQQFRQSRKILERLSETFVSARTMTRLFHNTLKGANKFRGHASGDSHEQTATEDAQRGPCLDTANRSASPNLNDPLHSRTDGLDGSYQDNDDGFDVSLDLFFSELDHIFDGFQSELDLSRIDTLFSTILNPTMPLISTEWMEI